MASIGSILVDMICFMTLCHQSGLPFGLLSSKYRFTDLTYFASPSFWSGSRGIRSRWRRNLIRLLLLVSAMIAVFIGPSSALLMIPSTGPWPGGGTRFWLVGTGETLWPEKLDSRFIGGAHCQDPSVDMIFGDQINSSGCIWNITPTLAQACKDWHLGLGQLSTTFDDGVVKREIWHTRNGTDIRAASSNAAISRISLTIGDQWDVAIGWAQDTLGILSPYSRLVDRDRSASVAGVVSPIPAVRTKCRLNVTASYNFTGELEVDDDPMPLCSHFG